MKEGRAYVRRGDWIWKKGEEDTENKGLIIRERENEFIVRYSYFIPRNGEPRCEDYCISKVEIEEKMSKAKELLESYKRGEIPIDDLVWERERLSDEELLEFLAIEGEYDLPLGESSL